MIGARARLAALSIASAAALAPAVAAPTVYVGEDLAAGSVAGMPKSFAARDQFVAQLSGVGSEGFESFASGTEFFGNPLAVLDFAGSGTTASLTGGRVVNTPSDGRFPVDGTNFLRTSFNQRITFNSPVDAFGLFVIDANEVDNDPATVTIDEEGRPFDSVDGIFRIVTERSPNNFEVLFSGGTFPADGSALFVGLIDGANPYSNIILINGTDGLDGAFIDNFAYDQMTVGTMGELAPIPEPSTWVLMALGLAGVAGWARRRRG